ncbi:MAG: site-specific DNA-methyltransferase [Candidatus Pacebacteria bacterium]|nr:site-specific DNA-methyltransferase [Candidatus Paceibacterota bacterium]
MSPAPNTERIEQLKRLFPEIECEGKINFDTLRELLDGGVDDRPERYSFSWAGKRDAIRLLSASSRATLMPDRDESLDFDTTQNLFIEGDNLEALKLLYKSYFGRVKMIYIDPPYNTGNDFVYPDNYRDPLDTYLQLTGQRDAEGNLLTSNTDTGGRYHSAWLSMMYPRLFLARQLLREDGVIFISVDDHEVHNLRLLMNEIFGEENFVATFVRRRRMATAMRGEPISPDHEYAVCFARSRQAVCLFGSLASVGDYPHEDDKGKYRSTDLTVGMTKEMRPNQWFELVNPQTGKKYSPPLGRVWRFEPGTMARHVNEQNIIWPDEKPDSNMTRPRFKTRFDDAKEKPVSTWIAKEKDSGNEVRTLNGALNQEATKELRGIFGEQILEYPKPVSLLESLVQCGTRDKDIIMDFFAGSATTAQAVLELNREDGGNRRFIMVQLPERLEKPVQLDNGAELCTIADIGKERIRRVVEKMQSEREGELDLSERETPEDLGFRVYKLAESNFRQWEESQSSAFTRQLEQASASGSADASDAAESAATPSDPKSTGNTPDSADLIKQMALFTDPLVDGWKPEDVITEMTLREGLSLTSIIERVDDIAEATVYRVTDPAKEQSFTICLDDTLRLESLAPLGLTRDDLFICRDIALDDETAANLALQCRLKVI